LLGLTLPALAAEGARRLPWPRGLATPPLALPRLDGAPWRLADARGRVVLLNFWASWCEPCVAELPSLEELGRQRAAEGLSVVAINFRESEAAVRRFRERVPGALPLLLDNDGTAARAWQASIFPTTVAIDRRGRAVFTVVGEVDWSGAQAQAWIAPLLA
jgi:thiol-disulfide isomerase/thioredoxin